jgi:hypothetical protein
MVIRQAHDFLESHAQQLEKPSPRVDSFCLLLRGERPRQPPPIATRVVLTHAAGQGRRTDRNPSSIEGAKELDRGAHEA